MLAAVDLPSALRGRLEDAAPGGVSFGVPLAQLSRWRIGGPAAALVEPSSTKEAAEVLGVLSGYNVPVVVVGETSNILFDSRGFSGVLIRIGSQMADMEIRGQRIWAQAGISIPLLARRAAEAGLAGLQHTCGIPGTLGGLVLMNGGSQRKGIGESVLRALCADETGHLEWIGHDEFEFAYRSSSLQRRTAAILEVELELGTGSTEELIAEVEGILDERARKFPLDLPNCGSTFLSDPAMYATVGPPGRAIEEAGLKGLRHGDAEISQKHANFIVNNGSATDDDVLWLIARARHEVLRRTGFAMDCEVRHLDEHGAFRPAHVVAEQRWPVVSMPEEV